MFRKRPETFIEQWELSLHIKCAFCFFHCANPLDSPATDYFIKDPAAFVMSNALKFFFLGNSNRVENSLSLWNERTLLDVIQSTSKYDCHTFYSGPKTSQVVDTWLLFFWTNWEKNSTMFILMRSQFDNWVDNLWKGESFRFVVIVVGFFAVTYHSTHSGEMMTMSAFIIAKHSPSFSGCIKISK